MFNKIELEKNLSKVRRGLTAATLAVLGAVGSAVPTSANNSRFSTVKNFVKENKVKVILGSAALGLATIGGGCLVWKWLKPSQNVYESSIERISRFNETDVNFEENISREINDFSSKLKATVDDINRMVGKEMERKKATNLYFIQTVAQDLQRIVDRLKSTPSRRLKKIFLISAIALFNMVLKRMNSEEFNSLSNEDRQMVNDLFDSRSYVYAQLKKIRVSFNKRFMSNADTNLSKSNDNLDNCKSDLEHLIKDFFSVKNLNSAETCNLCRSYLKRLCAIIDRTIYVMECSACTESEKNIVIKLHGVLENVDSIMCNYGDNYDVRTQGNVPYYEGVVDSLCTYIAILTKYDQLSTQLSPEAKKYQDCLVSSQPETFTDTLHDCLRRSMDPSLSLFKKYIGLDFPEV